MIRISAKRLAQDYTRALRVVLVLAALLAASTMLVPERARADTTFVVTTTADPGNGVCDVVCTLREAISAANDTPGRDTINFRLSNTGEARTISPVSQLPAVTEAVTIDGYSQLGSSPNTLAKGTNANLLVELDGSNAAGESVDGLDIDGADVVVRGLVINRFNDDGIGISATGATIEGNFIGTDASGTQSLGNGDNGVFIDSGSGNKLGGTAPGARNLISGNADDGVLLLSGPEDTRIEGNLIGTKKDGVGDLGNADEGVDIITSSGNFIGGPFPGAGNTIAFNDDEGITVNPNSSGNRILSNSVFSNAGLGIDLVGGTEDAAGVTANDNRDPDAGPNELQNRPVVTSAVRSDGRTKIRGKLNSTPGGDFTVQIFANPRGQNEGAKLLGDRNVSTNSDGNASFVFAPRGKVGAKTVTATATDAAGNTSEFSAPRKVATRR